MALPVPAHFSCIQAPWGRLSTTKGKVGALRRRLSGVCVEGAVAERDIIGWWHGPDACTPTGGLRKGPPTDSRARDTKANKTPGPQPRGWLHHVVL